MRFVGRLKGGRYRGVIRTRLSGGTKPPKSGDWVLIVSSALGETRTALQAAEEISSNEGVPVAVLTQLAKMPNALRPEDSPFPIGFAPFNSPISAILCLLRWKPKAVLFVEFSGNYHLAFWAKVIGVRTALINVNLPEVRLRRLQRKLLGKWQFSFVDAFCCQAATHAERLRRLGVEEDRIYIAGIGQGPQLAGLIAREEVQRKWRNLLQIDEEDIVIVAGSTYHEEELQLLQAVEAFRRARPKVILVLAPRHLDRSTGATSALNALDIDFEKRSLLDRHQRVARTILLDSVGELREVYSIANIAFVGGSLVTSVGGHTPLEAFAWSVPITIGPHFGQQEAPVYYCEQVGLLHICASPEALVQVWIEILDHPERLQAAREQQHLLAENRPLAFANSYEAVRDMC